MIIKQKSDGMVKKTHTREREQREQGRHAQMRHKPGPLGSYALRGILVTTQLQFLFTNFHLYAYLILLNFILSK